jgi:apolipoprotein N-acyltransferase
MAPGMRNGRHNRTVLQRAGSAAWRGLRNPVRYAVLLAGALPILAFPAPNLEWLAWIGLIPGLLLMVSAATRREAAVRGWWFGTGYLLAALYWLIPNLGPGLLLVAIVIGALFGGVGLAAWETMAPPVTAPRAALALVLVPSAWLVTEWLRSWQGFGGPWAVLGVSQWQHPAVLALAAVGGVWLVTFALVAANVGLLIAIRAGTLAPRLIGCAGALAAIAAGPAAFALTAPSPAVRTVTVGLVQPGLIRDPGRRVAVSIALTRALAGRADLVVWGESSVGYDVSTDTSLLRRLQRLAAADHVQVLASQDALDAAGNKSKVAVLIGGSGIAGEYVKSRLVPFGEYIPLRGELGWLTGISRAAAENMVPGPGAHILQATLPDVPGDGGPNLTIGPLICFESAFPDMSRYDADHGAQLITYQTSDSTFQGSWALAQHASLSALRAAETGRPVVQAALTGDSVAFDARGRLLAWAGPAEHGSLTARLALPSAASRTPFDELGDYVPLTALAVTAGAALLWLSRRGQHVRLRRAPIRPDGPTGDRADVASDAGRAPDREVTRAPEAHAQESVE